MEQKDLLSQLVEKDKEIKKLKRINRGLIVFVVLTILSTAIDLIVRFIK